MSGAMYDSMNGPPPGTGPARHLLHQHATVRLHQPVQRGGVGRVVPVADVLPHLQRRDGVERRVGDVAVVLQPDLHAVPEAALAHALQDERALLLGERHPCDVDAVVLGGVQRQRPPAAPDVEEPLALGETELAADQVELVALGVLHRVRGVVAGPVPAGVGHLRVEDQGVEVVRQVVVVRDRLPVTQLGVQPAAQPRLGRRRRRGSSDHAEVARGAQAPGQHRRREPSGRPRLAHPCPHAAEAVEQVALDLELAGHVRLREAELAGPEHDAAQGVRGPQHDDGRVGRTGLAAVPGPQAHGQRAVEQRLHHLGEASGDAAVGGCGAAVGGGERGGHREPPAAARADGWVGWARTTCWTSRYAEAKPASE